MWRLMGLALVALAVSACTGWWMLGPANYPWPSNAAPVVAVIAGDGQPGLRDGPAADARFSDPFGVAQAPDGTIYVADAGDAQRIRRISPDGVVTTAAGGQRGFADGAGAAAMFDTPSGLALDSNGNLFVADTGNNAIRRLGPDGVVTTVAGDGRAGFRDGPARRARFNGPLGVALDASGRIIVADTYNDRIRAITSDGNVVTLAGGAAPGDADGAAAIATFDTPSGVAASASGEIYVADTGNGLVRVLTRNGTVTTISRPSQSLVPGGLLRPIGIATDDTDSVYVTDDRGRIVVLPRVGPVRIVGGRSPGFADGPAASARFRRPAGLAWANGRLVVADEENALVRVVATPEHAGFRPPPPPLVAPAFDADSFRWLPLLWPVEPMGGPHEVAGTMGEARGDAGGDGRDRFHAGIDIHEVEATPVLNVRPAVVDRPVATGGYGSLNEWLSVGPLMYIHLRVGRDARNTLLDPERFAGVYDAAGVLRRVRVKRGARFATGDVLGTINRFNHVHLNVGWQGEEHNPLLFRLPLFDDSIPPTIEKNGVRLYADDGTPIVVKEKGRLVLSGRVHIVVDAYDRADANIPRRRLGLYRLGYQLLDEKGTPVPGFETPRETMKFDRLGGDAQAPYLVFAPGSGIPFYGTRLTRFRYEVTNTLEGGTATAGAFDTATIAPGHYTLRLLVSDTNGTEAIENRDVLITIRR
jgi:sugar lactone lactonase YvrE